MRYRRPGRAGCGQDDDGITSLPRGGILRVHVPNEGVTVSSADTCSGSRTLYGSFDGPASDDEHDFTVTCGTNLFIPPTAGKDSFFLGFLSDEPTDIEVQVTMGNATTSFRFKDRHATMIAFVAVVALTLPLFVTRIGQMILSAACMAGGIAAACHSPTVVTCGCAAFGGGAAGLVVNTIREYRQEKQQINRFVLLCVGIGLGCTSIVPEGLAQWFTVLTKLF